MFETFRESRVPPHPFFESNTIEWDFVMLSLNLPWFYVSWGFRSSDQPSGARVELRFLPYVSLLRKHLEEADPEYFVKEIQLVSPGWLNQSERTQMQPLVKLISFVEAYGTEFARVEFAYEVMGGVRYPAGLDWDKLKSVKIIFDKCQLQNF